ncbi:hypothetical protein HCG51_34765 (plasmid) [Tolypothrix sp. PCC 7910]|uniref:hypothetical protein n=1 Tax=Tolypothrix sp. PCC 7910 TaxID=2099387 RepID=UPI00142775D2|nr:hypothetical protein [Tolypothrix sp. PCC 7910]QIR41847.1 hypothetical protein HCG51_34765 [Tolypothrix sp. PCC 7910]
MSKLSVVGEGLLSPHNSTNIIEINKHWHKWQKWLETAQSFRYVPNNNEPPYTARQEKGSKGQASYWYGYRKVGGVLRKRYIGRGEDLSITKLDEIAYQLSNPTPKKKVTQIKSVTKLEDVEKLTAEVVSLQSELQRKEELLAEALGKLIA